MIFKSEIKDKVFENYDLYIKEASQYHIKKYGLYAEDLVNEAIIGVMDCEKEFEDIEQLNQFVLKAIKNIFYSEYELSKKVGGDEFQQQFDEGNIMIRSNYIPVKLDELYDLFYDIRFPSGLKCSKCGSIKVIERRGNQTCLLCNTFVSITNNTWMKKMKISFSQLYKFAQSICDADRINYKIISHDSGVKEISPLFKGRVQHIKKQIVENGTRDVMFVLKELLSVTNEGVEQVNTKIKLKKGGSFASLNRSLNQLNNLEYLIHANKS